MSAPPSRRGLAEPADDASDPADRLADALLVLDEREPNVVVSARAEPLARAHRDLRLTSELEGEAERSERAIRLRDRRPDEHRPLRPLEVPADARQAVAERVAAAAVALVHVGGVLGRLVHRDDRGDLDRLERAVVEVRLEPRERLHDLSVAD